MEKHYVFIKDNKVIDSYVFESENQELAQLVADERGFDSFVWVGSDARPPMGAEYDLATGKFLEIPGTPFVSPIETPAE